MAAATIGGANLAAMAAGRDDSAARVKVASSREAEPGDVRHEAEPERHGANEREPGDDRRRGSDDEGRGSDDKVRDDSNRGGRN